jgi:hypothetical protein
MGTGLVSDDGRPRLAPKFIHRREARPALEVIQRDV